MKKFIVSTVLSAATVLSLSSAPLYASSDPALLYPKYQFQPCDAAAWLLEAEQVSDQPSPLISRHYLLPGNLQVQITGYNDQGLARIKAGDQTLYCSQENLTLESPEEREAREKEEADRAAHQAWLEECFQYAGPVLTKSAGVVQGPSGKETYYNLDMSGVLSIMRGIGNEDPYWVREDGVKMLGDYIMVAADFSLRPRGSYVQTSLGPAIVCDTGSFIYSNPTQIDIAVAW